jgi:hypothetical protein
VIRLAAALLLLSSCWIQDVVDNCEVQPEEIVCERCRYVGQVLRAEGCTFICYEEDTGPAPEGCEEETWE